MRPLKFDLIIYDCDGTLVDTEELNVLSVCKVLEEEGLPQYDEAYCQKHFTGILLRDMFDHISKETGHIFPNDIFERRIKWLKKLEPDYFREVDGARDFVKRAAEYGYTQCVASNGQKANVISSLTKARMIEFFPENHIYNGNDVPNPKPAPDIFLKVAADMGVAPERTLVLEDSLVGCRAAIDAGMTVWGVPICERSPKEHGKKLSDLGVDHVMPSFIHMDKALFN